MDFAASVNVSEGFGGGAGSGELCGAISGAIMVLGLMNPVDPEDVVGSKRRMMKLSKELQKRFREQFEAVRCTDLLKNRNINAETAIGPAKEMGLTNHCAIMIVTAVDLVEQLLEEQGKSVEPPFESVVDFAESANIPVSYISSSAQRMPRNTSSSQKAGRSP